MARAVDVVVIGTGAGGAPAALALAEAGASVVMLERGPRYERIDFVHDEVAIARRDFFVPSAGTDPHIVVAKGRPPERTNEGWVASCVGGGTVHMSGFFYRFQPEDFRVRSFLGPISGATHADWPIDYEDLRPFYRIIEERIGISGPASEGPAAAPRNEPYPLPPVDNHPAAAWIDAAAKRLGVTAFPTPRAILSKDFRGRSKCVYCHLCGGFGCETEAKSSTLTSLIPQAEATGKCEVIAHAMVTHIEHSGGRATGVVYRGADGIDERIDARVVIVACSTIETARLLLMSDSSEAPSGLGNNGGQIGRNLMFSTLSKAHGAYRYDADPAREETLRDYSPFLGRSILDWYLPKNAPVKKAGALNFLFPSGGPIIQSEMVAMHGEGDVLWGKALKKRMREYWQEEKQMDCETFGEYLPTEGTRVELDPQVQDQFGLPVARILVDRHAHDGEVSKYLGERAKEVIEATGADRVWVDNVGGRTMHLPMGACRMGKSDDASAVDADCRLHEVDNVFITDGSVFASSGGAPPTYTILANSMRVGHRVRDKLAAGEL